MIKSERDYRNFVFVLFFALVGFGSVREKASADDLPNIIVILVDDLGYGELGCQGNSQIPTPNIDSIAEHGIRFTQGYVTASYCSPSRAGLLTGRHQQRFGYTQNPVGAVNDEPGVGLPLSEKTLARYLTDSGYVTGLFGKWHLGATSPQLPLRRGFGEFFGFLHEGHYYVPPPYFDMVTWLRRKVLPGGGKGQLQSKDGRIIYSTHMGQNEPSYDAGNPIIRGGQPVEEKEHLTDAITREANGFIRRNFDKPFFLFLSYNAVHSPMQGADRYMHRFRDIKSEQRRVFAAMLAHLDDSVGEVMGTLQQTRLTEKTLIFFLSDNGGPTKELTSSNFPLRGQKGTLYEGGVRVPFLVQWPRKLPARTVYRQPVSSLDIASTIQNIVEFKPAKKLDGVNLLPYLQGDRTGRPHEQLFWSANNRFALRSGDWKIVEDRTAKKNEQLQLFDLATDAGESQNLAQKNPEKLSQMQGLLNQAKVDHEVPASQRADGQNPDDATAK